MTAPAPIGPRDQHEVLAALRDPARYPHGPTRVEHVQTHISHVFLAGAFVYKLRKAVVFPFLDFRTEAARHHDCEEEVRLNRPWAPHVYLGVVPVTREDDGTLAIGGIGRPVDWLVHMRRLPEDRVLRHLVVTGATTPAMMHAIARHVARRHAEAPPVPGGNLDILRVAWTENLDELRQLVDHGTGAVAIDRLADFGRTFVTRHQALLQARIRGGRIREGHGDLRADHVYVLPPTRRGAEVEVVIIDCVEFASSYRTVDVAADLAFLAMDLEALGRPDLAETLVDAYSLETADVAIPALIPYYACHRATVRAKIDALTAAADGVLAHERGRARASAAMHLVLAERLAWRAGDPVTIVCVGLSGSGKSTVAAWLAALTGFAVVSTDGLRKDAAAPGTPIRYEPDARSAVYTQLRQRVEQLLGTNTSVIADGTFLQRPERDRLASAVRALGRRCVFVHCTASEPVIRARLDARDATAISDARWDVYQAQTATGDPFGADEPVVTIDTTEGVESAGPALAAALWEWRQRRPPGTLTSSGSSEDTP